jgi:hypothetical protein
VVPGILEAYDLPDLAAAIAPHPLTVRNPLDPAGKPVATDAVREAYAVCRKSYRAERAEELFRIEPCATDTERRGNRCQRKGASYKEPSTG